MDPVQLASGKCRNRNDKRTDYSYCISYTLTE